MLIAVLAVAAFTACDEARYLVRIRISAYPMCIREGRGFRQNIAITFGTEKLEWCGYPTVKKV